MAKLRRLLVFALAIGVWLVAPPVQAEIIVTPGGGMGVPLVIHDSPSGASSGAPVVVYVPQVPLYGPLFGSDTINNSTMRSNQSNLDRLLWRTDRLRGDSSATSPSSVILLSR